MNAITAPETVVLLFAGRPLPRPLRGLTTLPVADDAATVDSAIERFRRLVVVGGDAELARVLTRLLRADRLDVEVGYVPKRRAASRAATGTARPVPLIRDETGMVLVGAATWRGADGPLHGEAVVDDTVLFDGDVPGVRIEPVGTAPGLRAGVMSRRGRVRRWATGRAAQLGTTGALVVRDGLAAPRAVKRSTFYRHIEDWLLVR